MQGKRMEHYKPVACKHCFEKNDPTTIASCSRHDTPDPMAGMEMERNAALGAWLCKSISFTETCINTQIDSLDYAR